MSAADAHLPGPEAMRASTADREQVAGVLHRALSEGRISVDELQERLDTVYQAKTLGELEPVTRDLPEHRPLVPVATPVPLQKSGPMPLPATGSLSPAGPAIAILGGAERKGEWVIGPTYTITTIMGGVDIDLTNAIFLSDEVVITVVAIMAGVEIRVPDDVQVDMEGVGIMGAFESSVPRPTETPRVRIRVRGLAFWAGVDVKRLSAKQRKKLEKQERKKLEG
ncbi:DUF1707 domain-containing protein [Nakamurella sp. YIM 132087]|uniref:DUF1707 domain-containing protein n=1 Tax=Nakamurella alba TaxID=2665158 RepID=A0A7K1FHE1_9ACTN|nr:DUF1707 domain-containing protein [Nakamurella alba]MTD13547.1 DUF1707 domain-containing protein [Nakamurella alba]